MLGSGLFLSAKSYGGKWKNLLREKKKQGCNFSKNKKSGEKTMSEKLESERTKIRYFSHFRLDFALLFLL